MAKASITKQLTANDTTKKALNTIAKYCESDIGGGKSQITQQLQNYLTGKGVETETTISTTNNPEMFRLIKLMTNSTSPQGSSKDIASGKMRDNFANIIPTIQNNKENISDPLMKQHMLESQDDPIAGISSLLSKFSYKEQDGVDGFKQLANAETYKTMSNRMSGDIFEKYLTYIENDATSPDTNQ